MGASDSAVVVVGSIFNVGFFLFFFHSSCPLNGKDTRISPLFVVANGVNIIVSSDLLQIIIATDFSPKADTESTDVRKPMRVVRRVPC